MLGRGAAVKLEEESAVRREERVVQEFREALLDGKLDLALQQLDQIISDPSNKPVTKCLLISLTLFRRLNTISTSRNTWSFSKQTIWMLLWTA